MNYVSDWIDTLCMEWQKQLNDFMIIDGLEDANVYYCERSLAYG